MKKTMLLAIAGLGLAMSGCATIPNGERGYTFQSHTVILGLYVPLFDLAGGQAAPKLALGYVTNDTQITPEGATASQTKIYENVLGDNEITSQQEAK